MYDTHVSNFIPKYGWETSSDKRPRAGDQKYKYELRSGFGDVEQR